MNDILCAPRHILNLNYISFHCKAEEFSFEFFPHCRGETAVLEQGCLVLAVNVRLGKKVAVQF